MQIDKSQVKISFDFSPKDYYLCHSEQDGYSLNYRIDRSYAGKEDIEKKLDLLIWAKNTPKRQNKNIVSCLLVLKIQDGDVGQAKIFLTDDEAEVCRQEGFDEVI